MGQTATTTHSGASDSAFGEQLNALTRALAERAAHFDSTREWPAESLEAFGAAGGWRWGLPEASGGLGLSPVQRLRGYAAVAEGDMSAALYLTQHEGASELILGSPNGALREELTPQMAAGRCLLTIGYSQLTTSHQDGPPALRAELGDDEIVLDGFMPWVTGAPCVHAVTAGAVLADGTQLVVLVPLSAPGIRIEAPMSLLAMNSTLTCVVRCDGVRLGLDRLVLGPERDVLARRSGLRGLAVSACGIGVLRAIDAVIARSAAKIPSGASGIDFAGVAAQMQRDLEHLATADLSTDVAAHATVALRAQLNETLVRAAGIMLTIAKGRGFMSGQDAERLYREASFFCVWSASDAVRAGTINGLTSRASPIDV
ncbi:MAG: acyl-CoA/acyl-ACP dehydrogenase [Gammaproteobacteria bacterium]|nr:acyl-CoA/acyl-ACP dehydrogenase [Gammaproteobacteria bacterium]